MDMGNWMGISVAVVFLSFVALTIGGALVAVLATRVIRSVCGLAICCFGLAGLYYFLHSPFLALMEILIYIGAVCVTIIFAIMLAEPDEPELDAERAGKTNRVWAVVALVPTVVVFFALAHLSLNESWPKAPAPAGDGSLHAIGVALLTTYSLAFELISLVLLAAILGALAVAREGRAKE